MKNVNELPGAQLPGITHSLDRYDTAMGRSPEADPVIRGVRERYKQEHGIAPYIAPLVRRVRGTMPELPFWTPPLAESGITKLLTQQYGITLPEAAPLHISGVPTFGTFLEYDLFYRFGLRKDLDDAKLHVTMNGNYDFVNLEALHIPDLVGEANIAHLPGLEGALIEDCELLLRAYDTGEGDF